MRMYFYVEFANLERRKNCPPYSPQPLYYHNLLHHKIDCVDASLDLDGLRERIHACWLSKFPLSLDLLVEMTNTDPQTVRCEAKLLTQSFVGAVHAGVPADAIIEGIEDRSSLIYVPRFRIAA
jgi:hypothetical protein